MKVEYGVSNNVLIVESHNDKIFIERLKREISNSDFDIDTPICNITDYECLDGLSKRRLEDKLQEIKRDIGKRGLNKIGIMIDADDKGIAPRVELINQVIKRIDPDLNILAANAWYKSESLDVHISCHILNVSGQGELETLLKAIKSKPSDYADCLTRWKNCIETRNQFISDKDFDKFWVSVYQRYDGCNKNEQKQAGRKCNFEASLQKGLWDFSHPALAELKSYLLSFT